jgi:hypothetical protein
LPKKDFVKITYYAQRADYKCFMDAAKYLYDQGAIPRPTAGTYSRAAAFMMFKELATRLAKVQQELASV